MTGRSRPDQVAVIGGGFCGLAAAYELSRRGLRPIVFERDSGVGGLAGSFTVNGTQLEKFYHHWFTSDESVLRLVREMGTSDQIQFRPTATGMYHAHRFYRLSTPLDVLRFRSLPVPDRFRLGLLALRARRVLDWRRLEGLTAAEWLRGMGGDTVYEIVWEPLLRGKFGQYANEVSAVWFWNKLKLRGGSRGKGGEELLAYYRGGFAALARQMVSAIEDSGGTVLVGHPVEQLRVRDGAVVAVEAGGKEYAVDAVIATPALPLIANLVEPHVSRRYVDDLRRIKYLGNVCLVLELSRRLSGIYWLNVNDPGFPFVGVIEHTNFQPAEGYGGRHIVYLSRYAPPSDHVLSMGDDEVLAFAVPHLQRMFPQFRREWILRHHVWRARYSQPIVEREYGKLIPPRETPLRNFLIATMAQIYPEDRGTNYAIREGRRAGVAAARMLDCEEARAARMPARGAAEGEAKTEGHIRVLSFLALLAPLLFFAYTALLAPRPYFIREMDLEPDYYYNSRVIHSGNPVACFHHPGTPVYGLGALLLGLSGDAPEQAQRFCNIGYGMVAILTGLAGMAFVRLNLRRVPIGVSALAVALVYVWPPLLTFLNHFGSESFVVAIGLPTLALFWKSLESRSGFSKRLLFLSGVGTGLGLATKMTFLPVAAVLLIACAAGKGPAGARRTRDWIPGIRGAASRTATLGSGMAVSFLLGTAPIFSHLPAVFYRTFRRPEAHPDGSLWREMVRAYTCLLRSNWLYASFLILLCALLLLAILMRVRDLLTHRQARGDAAVDSGVSHDNPAALVFVSLMTAAFAYTMASSGSVVAGYEPGVGLRNVSPCALFAPFLLLHVRIGLHRKGWWRAISPRWRQALGLLLSILLLGIGLHSHLTRRGRFIAEQTQSVAASRRRLEQLRVPGARIAVWNGVSRDILAGPASFHFLGNCSYAYNRFDRELLAAYPEYTMFDLHTATMADLERNAVPGRSGYGALGDLFWRLVEAPGPYRRTGEVYTGETSGITVGLFVFPRSELEVLAVKRSRGLGPSRRVTEADLLERIQSRTGGGDLERETIAGTEYLLLDASPGLGQDRSRLRSTAEARADVTPH